MKKLVVLALVLCMVASMTTVAMAADQKVTMKVGTIENVNNLGAKAVDKFAELMKERTNGNFIIETYHASQLGDAMAQLDQVKSGTIQAFRCSISWLGGYVGDVAIVEFPYMFKTAEEAEKVIMGPTMSAVNDRLAQEHGIRWVTASWSRLPRHILTKNPVTKLADLKGVKLRVPDSKTYIESFKAMGVATTIVAFNETYLALQQGLVDGAENHVESLYNMKWYEVAKNLALTGHAQDVTGFMVNDAWWQSVPEEYKQIFIDTDKEVNEWFKGELAKASDDYINKMKAEGVTVYEVDVSEFQNAVMPSVAYAIENEGFWAKGLVDNILAELAQ